jgi:hypothetical protein
MVYSLDGFIPTLCHLSIRPIPNEENANQCHTHNNVHPAAPDTALHPSKFDLPRVPGMFPFEAWITVDLLSLSLLVLWVQRANNIDMPSACLAALSSNAL